MEIIPLTDLFEIPWKNGGGITRNIVHATLGNKTVWRISRADVAQTGAFSSFPALERILTVVSDTGMTLEHPNGVLNADPCVPVKFSGALEVSAHLNDGPLTDLNLMFDPTICQGAVTILRGPSVHEVADTKIFHVIAGQPALETQLLGAGDTVFIDHSSTLNLSKRDIVLQISITYLDQRNDIKLSIAER